MNYRAFTNDSLTMMYEAVRGALAADDALNRQGIATQFRVRETPEWKRTPLISNRKCSSAECFSRSSTGRKIRRRCPLRNESADQVRRLQPPANLRILGKELPEERAVNRVEDGCHDRPPLIAGSIVAAICFRLISGPCRMVSGIYALPN